MAEQIYSLNIHAHYRCQNTGLCCSLGWDIPLEVPIYRSLTEAMSAGALRVAPGAEHLPPFVVGPDMPEGVAAMFQRTEVDQCVFFERESRLCVVHRDLGEPALASTCRNFPRLALRDARGTFVTLSHFCPTAAAMLFTDDRHVGVVAAPPAFPLRDYDGLDVTVDDLPPLLHPRMLMDLDGYTAWEQHMVARCADLRRAPESVLATLVRDARLLARWTPSSGRSLTAAVAALPGEFLEAPPHATLAVSRTLETGVVEAIPDDLKPEPDDDRIDEAYADWVAPAWAEFHAPLNRFIAGKAFACWTAYQGKGVASIVHGLEAAVGLVRVHAARQCRNAGRRLDRDLLLEAFRDTDFALNHLAIGEDLALGWSRVED